MPDITPRQPRNFRWIIDGQMAGSARPEMAEHVHWMAANGVGAIVSATPMAREAEHAARALGLELLSLPIEDYGIPTEAQVAEFLAFTRACIDAGRPVLVHCMAGIGRTGTLCSLWLVQHGMSAEDALDRVGVESPGQRALLAHWESRSAS